METVCVFLDLLANERLESLKHVVTKTNHFDIFINEPWLPSNSVALYNAVASLFLLKELASYN